MALIGRHSRQADFRGYYRGLFVSIEDAIRADALQTMVTEQTRGLLSQQADLRALGTALNLAEHRVRTNMAAELHDHLAQMLALGRMKLGQARQVNTLPQAVEYIGQTEAVLMECLTYTRTLVAELSPPVLHEFGLPAALTWLARHMQRYDLLVTCELPISAPWKIAHEEAILLFQSVRELLINVAKHAEAGKATVRLHATESTLHLSVQDAGRGFDPAALTQSGASQSSKFGLFSIRERMRALGGAFEVTSAPGAGTRSTLTLPLRADAPTGVPAAAPDPPKTQGPLLEAGAAHEDSAPSPSQTKIRVLLVDDHLMLRESLRTVVNSYDHLHVIAEASNGVEAVDAVRAFSPHVVVMDINMPVMNGIEAARRIKLEFPHIGIVGLSIHDGGDMVERMSAAGISAYVTKEAAVKTLCRAIEEAAARRV
jgi:CheY-like chemotaxis protein